MEISLDRKNGIPLYLQLKDQIKHLIHIGVLSSNDKLPPERELAEQLKVSRNTASMAYKELESEGILLSLQGRGTFVADSNLVLQQESMKEKLLRIVDLAIEDAAGLGFSLDEFLALTQVRVMEKKDMLRKLKIAFIECHPEQLEYFVKEVKLGPGVNIIPILLEELRQSKPKMIEVLSTFDMIVTSLSHLNEVNHIMPKSNHKILGIALEPQIETIVRIAKLPPQARVSIVCQSEAYSQRVQQAMERAGVNHLKWQTITDKLESGMFQVINEASAIIVNSSRRKEVEQFIKGKLEVIEFRFLPDAGSLNMIKSVLMECKK